MSKKIILAISGSTRKNATNEALLKYIEAVFPEDVSFDFYREMTNLPYFSPDLDNDSVPVEVQDLRDRIAGAAGVIICTPEYVFALPGVLKNAIEWTVSTTVFLDKPVALIVASGLGEITFASLTRIMETVGAKIGNDSRLLIQGARGKFDEHEKPKDDKTKQEIQRLLASFWDTIKSS